MRETHQNLQTIEELKARMAKLQVSNIETARENDGLRGGAISSVKTIQTAQLLQKQVEELSVALAEKAVTIRKLLEANA